MLFTFQIIIIHVQLVTKWSGLLNVLLIFFKCLFLVLQTELIVVQNCDRHYLCVVLCMLSCTV